MRRRPVFLLLCLAAASCASPYQRPAVPPPAPAPGRAHPAPPAPPLPVKPPTASGDQVFDAWAADFYPRAVAAGISPAVLDREFAGLTPDPRVESLDSRQPEFSKPVGAYIQDVVTPGRDAIGARKMADVPGLDFTAYCYGVPKEILLGIWAMESGFGAIQGDFDVVRSMATLAAQGRRRAFAEHELIAALKIIQSGEWPRSQLFGSWAGAMGQTQLIPSSFLSTAVDGDFDGKRDIWTSPDDALASAANLLVKGGWKAGESWAREVTVPAGFDWSLSEGPKLTPVQWAQMGVTRADGLPWDDVDAALPAQLVAPAGAAGPVFLLFPNHFVIRKYNNSLAYALAVGMLADRFSGMGPLVKPWPVETPLSLADRLTAQRALNVLGYDVGQPDGIVGMKTRAGLRAWQKSQGLTADGYLSMAMVQRLQAQAEAGPTGPASPAAAPPADAAPAARQPPPEAPPQPPSTNEAPLASGPNQVITASRTAITPQTSASAKP